MSHIDFDFAVILTLLTLCTGVVWVLDKLWLGPQRRAQLSPGTLDKPSGFVDFCRSFFPVILLVLLLRSFLAEPFRIPSGSMIPTLHIGDFILVNKFAYGLRDPVFNHEFLKVGRPQRGDVTVFRFPLNPKVDYIKRIIGLPGDVITYRNKQLSVNGDALPLDADGVYTAAGGSTPGVVYRFSERLDEKEHHIIVNPARMAEDFEFEVPAGHYFAMGDNRDGSYDSRGWGPVPEQNLVGKGFFIWMSWNAEAFRPEWSRIGNRIH